MDISYPKVLASCGFSVDLTHWDPVRGERLAAWQFLNQFLFFSFSTGCPAIPASPFLNEFPKACFQVICDVLGALVEFHQTAQSRLGIREGSLLISRVAISKNRHTKCELRRFGCARSLHPG